MPRIPKEPKVIKIPQVTCFQCKLKTDKIPENVIQLENKKYYHLENCYPKYLIDQAAQDIENQHWSNLFEYIKVLHNLTIVPSRTIKRLHALRYGSDIKKNETYKRYKIGIEYDLMLEAYIVADEKIKWFMNNVLKGDDAPSDISACITMMLDHGLNQAWKNRQQKKKRDEEHEKISKMQSEDDRSTASPVVYKKKNDDMDISHLL